MSEKYTENCLNRVTEAAKQLHLKILSNAYYAAIRAVEEETMKNIRTENNPDFDSDAALLFKMEDGNLCIVHKRLNSGDHVDEIDKAHVVIGNELGHIVLKHEFVEDMSKRARAVYLDNDDTPLKKDKKQMNEAKAFSLALFCHHTKLKRPHRLSFRYTPKLVHFLGKPIGISLEQVKQVFQKFKTNYN